MVKLILHLIVAVSLWYAVGSVGMGGFPQVIAIMVGVIGVHLVWERLFFDPLIYLGSMPVAKDDPLMMDANRQAKENLKLLETMFPERQKDTMVKFRCGTDTGAVETLWADLLTLSGENATVYVRTIPVEHDGDFEPNRDIRTADIVDFHVEMPDGTIRGGYTNFALFKILERKEGHLHAKLRHEMMRYVDCYDADGKADKAAS